MLLGFPSFATEKQSWLHLAPGDFFPFQAKPILETKTEVLTAWPLISLIMLRKTPLFFKIIRSTLMSIGQMASQIGRTA